MRRNPSRTTRPKSDFASQEVEDADDIDHEEEDASSSSSEEEDVVFRRGKAKATGARAKTPSKTPSKAARSKTPAKAAQDIGSPDTLFGVLHRSKNVDAAAAAIVHRLQEAATRNGAMLDLVNLVFQTSGAEGNVVYPSDAFDELDMAVLAGQFAETVTGEEGGSRDFPLSDVTTSTAAAAHVMALSRAVTAEDAAPSAPRGGSSKSFRDSFHTFWNALIDHAGGDLLFDEAGGSLAEALSDMLSSLSSAKHRALRHTASLAGMCVGRALARKASSMRDAVAVTQKQLDAESATYRALIGRAASAGLRVDGSTSLASLKAMLADSRKGRGAAAAARDGTPSDSTRLATCVEAAERLQSLKASLAAQSVACESADAAADALHKAVFAHRYRDVSFHIRADVLACFTGWMLDAPSTYLTNVYLKYVGWMLHDGESPTVRASALAAIVAAYQLPDAHTVRMGDFMSRFRARVSDMLRDVDIGVARTAMNVLHCALLQDSVDVASLDAVRAALLSDDTDLRRGAARFLLDQLPVFTQKQGDGEGDDATASPAITASASKKAKEAASKAAAVAASAAAHRARAQLLTLIETGACLVTEAAASARATGVMEYIASAFWGEPQAAVLAQWDVFVQLLLHGHSSRDGEDASDAELDDFRALLCLRLLGACAARAGGACLLDGDVGVYTSAAPQAPAAGAASSPPLQMDMDGTGAAVLSRTPEALDRSRDAFTHALAPSLPDLCVRYASTPTSVILLSSIVLQMSPATLSAAVTVKCFNDTLYQWTKVMSTTHAQADTLSACALVLQHMCTPGHPRARDAEAAVKKMVNALAARVVKLWNGIDTESSTRSDAAWPQLLLALRRLRCAMDVLGGVAVTPEARADGGVSDALVQILAQVDIITAGTTARGDLEVQHGAVTEVLGIMLATFAADFAPAVEAARSGAREQLESARNAAPALIASRDRVVLAALRLMMTHARPRARSGLHDADEDASVDHLPFADVASDVYASRPTSLPAAVYMFIHHCRMAGYAVLSRVAQLCAPAALENTHLAAVAWLPSDDACRVVAQFVNDALAAPPAQLRASGMLVPSAATDDMDEDDEDAPPPVVDEAHVHALKALHILAPLARMSLAAPAASALGHLLGRRVLDGVNEAGALGTSVIKAYIKAMKEHDSEGLLLAQLHSMQECCSSLGSHVYAMQRARGMHDADDDDDADERVSAATLAGTIAEAIAGAFAMVKRQAQNVGVAKVGKGAKLPLIRMLQRGIEHGIDTLSETGGTIFALLALYVPLVPRDVVRKLVYDYAKQRVTSKLGRDDAEAILAATTKWSDRLLAGTTSRGGHVPAVDMSPTGIAADGFTQAQLLPYLSLLFFLRSASGASAVKKVQSTAQMLLRLQCGLTGASSSSGPASATKSASKTRRRASTGAKPKQVASKRHLRVDDDDEDEEEDEEVHVEEDDDDAADEETRAASSRKRSRVADSSARPQRGTSARSDSENVPGPAATRRAPMMKEDSQLLDDSDEISLVRRPTPLGLGVIKSAAPAPPRAKPASSASKPAQRRSAPVVADDDDDDEVSIDAAEFHAPVRSSSRGGGARIAASAASSQSSAPSQTQRMRFSGDDDDDY